MIDGARNGLHVVRLKGGNPFVFGRGGEEIAGAVAAGTPVTVVSGISSAISVPGAAGIPVTHRNVSHLFTIVSGHAPLAAREYTSDRARRDHRGAHGRRHRTLTLCRPGLGLAGECYAGCCREERF